MTAGHLAPDLVGVGLFGGHPRKVERIMARLGIPIDGHDIGEAYSVLARVVKARNIRVGKVLGNSERRGVGGKSR